MGEPMAQRPADDIPAFWTEPWRWASRAWHAEYGAPPRELDRFAERLIYGGWADCFGLRRRWHPPADSRWLTVIGASPAVLRDMASVLGHLGSLRAGVSVPHACRAPIDPWLAFALRYRDVNCLRAQTRSQAQCGETSSTYACGVSVLRAMARSDWPHADARFAMLMAADGRAHEQEPQASLRAPTLIVDRIHVGRCLSLCCAVVRHAAAQAASRGRQ
ncbi:hypothetical protein [Trinickia sp.]|uniref:hypothetical protein n=1 Tax=Trinickia sp. TaxID=2571163 RepID=UPI003F7FDC75